MHEARIMTIATSIIFAVLVSVIVAEELTKGARREKRFIGSNWLTPNADEIRKTYIDKRRFGTLKFGKRPFGTLKFGKRNDADDTNTWLADNDGNTIDKRPFGSRALFGKRDNEYEIDTSLNNNDENVDKRPFGGYVFNKNNYRYENNPKSKRYSDVLDNLYLQSVLHKLHGRSAPWNSNKRARTMLFGKRSSDAEEISSAASDLAESGSHTSDDREVYKRLLKFGKRNQQIAESSLGGIPAVERSSRR